MHADTTASQIVFALIVFFQLAGAVAAHEPTDNDIQISLAHPAEWQAAPYRVADALVTESGWLRLTIATRPALRSLAPVITVRNALRAETQPAFPSTLLRDVLAVRAELDAARYGRFAAQPTTIPPPRT